MSNWSLAVSGGEQATIAESVSVTSGAANTQGAWVEMAASLAFPISALLCYPTHPTRARIIYEVGIGESGSEIVAGVFAYLSTSPGGSTNNQSLAAPYIVPLAIKAGQRIAIRSRALEASVVTTFLLSGVRQSTLYPVGYTTMRAIGLVTSPVNNTPFNTSPSAFGSWTELSADSGMRARGLAVAIAATQGINVRNARMEIEVGIGAAGSEMPLARVSMSAPFSDWPVGQLYSVLPYPVPANSRLAVRGRGSSATIGAVLYLFS